MKTVLLNSGGLDSALKAKELKNEGHEVHSLFLEFKGQLGLDKIRAAAEETAKNYCDSHHTVYVDLGYTPNLYQDSTTFLMYDDAKGVPTRTNLLTGETEDVPLQSGPPNLSSVCLSLAVSYAARIGADKVYSGFAYSQLYAAVLPYEQAYMANEGVGKYHRISIDAPTEMENKEAKLEELKTSETEFDYTSKSVPLKEV